MTGVRITISPGELLDRITILEVRASRTSGEAQKAAKREAGSLCRIAAKLDLTPEVILLKDRLRAVNEEIWETEDMVRFCIKQESFGGIYVKVTRAAHEKNDERARLKAEINKLLGAPVEQKSYGENNGRPERNHRPDGHPGGLVQPPFEKPD